MHSVFFMGKKELTVEQELKDCLDKTYEKVVPAHVREYAESKLDQASPQEETPEQRAQEQQPELDDVMQKLYENHVPASVREYGVNHGVEKGAG